MPCAGSPRPPYCRGGRFSSSMLNMAIPHQASGTPTLAPPHAARSALCPPRRRSAQGAGHLPLASEMPRMAALWNHPAASLGRPSPETASAQAHTRTPLPMSASRRHQLTARLTSRSTPSPGKNRSPNVAVASAWFCAAAFSSHYIEGRVHRHVRARHRAAAEAELRPGVARPA